MTLRMIQGVEGGFAADRDTPDRCWGVARDRFTKPRYFLVAWSTYKTTAGTDHVTKRGTALRTS